MRLARVCLLVSLAALGCATAATKPAPAAPSTGAPFDEPGTMPGASTDEDPDVEYYRQARRPLAMHDVKAARALDFKRFRRGSMLIKSAPSDAVLDDPLNEAMQTGDDARVLHAAHLALVRDCAYIRGHIVAGNLKRKQGDIAEADLHRAYATGLLDSIVASGDGKTAATAFVVFHVREEYELMRASGFRVLRQALHDEGGRTYDVLTVEPEARAKSAAAAPERTVYFDITELFAQEARLFEK
jgi:hypothetical protein